MMRAVISACGMMTTHHSCWMTAADLRQRAPDVRSVRPPVPPAPHVRPVAMWRPHVAHMLPARCPQATFAYVTA